MKKLIKLEFNNTTRERKTEDSYSELYSHDKNNGSFEFEILNDTLTTEQVIALFKFTESNKIWKTTGTVEGNKVKVTFDTTLITQNETVICYLYFDEEQRTSDTFRFKFKVKVSEIDKMSRYEVKERFINNTVIVDRLDVVTKTELQEALKNVGGIATEGLLTEVKAEETYAKKSEAVDNTNFELVKNRVLALELKTDKDTVYDDREVKERLTTLENKQPVDLSNYATKEELRNVSGSQPLADNLVTKEELENKHYISDVSNLATKDELQEVRNNQPTVDTSHLVTRDELTAKNYLTEHQSLDNLVTKQELEEKHYLTTHQDLSEYAKKSELYNDSDLKARVEVLEQKTDKDTVYDDAPLKERVTALESKAIEGGAYDDKPIRDRLDVLEAKHDNDTIYDDTEVKHRLTELENKPAVDTSFFVTEDKLNSKGYLTQHQDLSPYALKSEIPAAYNDSLLNERVTALESKAIEGGAYNDTDLRNRVINLENKPALDTSEFVTNQALESRGYLTTHQSLDQVVTKDELASKNYISDVSNLVTKEELASKNYLTEHQPLTEVNNRLDVLEAKQDRDTVYNDTELRNRVTELESRPIVTPYNDTPLKERVEVLENKVDKDTVYNDEPIKERLTVLETKVDKDTVYNDSELRERVTNLENKPNVDLSNYVTNEQLENKHYLTQHQELTHLATTSDLEVLRNIAVSKSELNNKLDTTEFNTFKDNVVTKTELAEKGYISDLSNYVTKEELHEATEIDYSNIVTTDELEPYAKKTEIPQPYNDKALSDRVLALENKPSTGGAQTQDTGWITISEENPLNGNIVRIRRVNDMVYVSLNNPDTDNAHLQLEVTDGHGAVLAEKEIQKGFTPMRTVIIPVISNIETIMLSTDLNTTGQAVFNVVNNRVTLKAYDKDITSGIPTNKYINDFSYFTEDPFPVELQK